MFANRAQAAGQLINRLQHYRGKTPLVLAIPRGAVPMGRAIADGLGGDLDVVLVRKLGAPGNPELAVGSVDETGWTYVAPYAASHGADAEFIEAEKQRQLATIRRRRAAYSVIHPARDPAGRVVIVVDDGLATGATMIAALHALRARHPATLVCAVPVAPPDTLTRITPLTDEVVCLQAPVQFQAVGQFYRDFPQVDDAQVRAILARR